MKTFSAGFASDVASDATTHCWCWRMTRKDGVVDGFSDHDEPVIFDGVSHEPMSGFTASQAESNLGLAVSNMNADGVLSSAKITEANIYAGVYDDASVQLYRVNWAQPAHNALIAAYVVGQMSRGPLAFSAELRSIASRLGQAKGRVYSRLCDVELGSPQCGIDLTASGRHATGTVTTPIDKFQFQASGLSGLTSTLARGKVVWLTGANAGLTLEVRAWLTGAAATVWLMLPAPRPIAIGDTFTCTVGCDKAVKTCHDDFDNVKNHRGAGAFMPGNDFAAAVVVPGDHNDGGAGAWAGHFLADLV